MEIIVIDVRERWEFAFGCKPDSINIPVHELPEHLEELRAFSGLIILCCATGSRSGLAANYLFQEGIENVTNGGGWKHLIFTKYKNES